MSDTFLIHVPTLIPLNMLVIAHFLPSEANIMWGDHPALTSVWTTGFKSN